MKKNHMKRSELYTLTRPPPEGWSLRQIRKIGVFPGRSNKVFLAEIRASKEQFVLKKLDKNSEYPKMSSYNLEKEIHLKCCHPNVVRTFGTIETHSSVYLMFEFAEGGDLLSCPFFGNERRIAQCIRGVAKGLLYLRGEGIVHRDVKAENVVIGDSGDCKIIDFGFAAKLPGSRDVIDNCSCVGTIDYLSPEIIWGLPYDQMVDIWSLGVLSYLLLCGHYPFSPHTTYEDPLRRTKLLEAIVSGNFVRGKAFRRISGTARDFIVRLLVLTPDLRLTPDEVLEHPFLLDSMGSSPDTRASSNRSSSRSSEGSSSSSEGALELFFNMGERGEEEFVQKKKRSF